MPFTLSSRTYGRSNTEPTKSIPGPAKSRSWLTRVLAGEVELSSFAPVAVSTGRSHGPDAAIAGRALGCPDLFVLDCPDTATRERHILNLIRAAADRSECILMISPDPAAADRLVDFLAADRTLRTVRALSEDENPLRPSSSVSRLTSTSVGSTRAEQLRREAVQTVSALEAKLAGLERSRELNAKLVAIETERKIVASRRDSLEAEVRERNQSAQAPPRCREIQAEREAILARRTELERLPITRSGILARLLGFAKPPNDHTQELKQLTERDAALLAECEAVAKQQAEENAKQFAEQKAAFEKQLADLDAEAARVDESIRRLHPQAASEDTVENGEPSSSRQAELERELAVARTRQQELMAAGPDLARRLLAETRIVIGTPGAVGTDAVFEALGETPFDRIILDHAEELTESAFEHFATLASRWILAGDATPPPVPAANGRTPRPHPAPLLPRLARLLDREPWRIEGDRLIVRLVHLTDAQRRGFVREPLLDHPDVELGVATLNGEPVVSEIVFPAGTAIPAAKAFLVSQLGEVVLRTCGEPEWQGLTATWPAFHSCEGEWIDLEPGIREKIVGRGTAAFTAALEFDPASWDEAAARNWLAARSAPPLSRIASLPSDRPIRRPVYSR